ncbi:MAG: DUF547 domain-containing protein [Candidatus Eisenbacteria bacterium]|nr:DUF547 domain-containing protein [Candidatus Eisenbacteria bacterium]
MPVPTPTRRSRSCPAALAFAAIVLLGAAPAPAQTAGDTGWQALLDRYLRAEPAVKGQPAETRFDYEQLYVDEGIWPSRSSARLSAIHQRMFAVTPSALEPKARMAWALNAYNFLVVERATLLLLVPRHKFQRYESVAQMSSGDGGFFEAQVAQVEGRSYSIGQFERWFVYGDSTPMYEPRRVAGDPRLMFALCRGSVGGPSLPARAFKPESLDAQLDRCTRNALESSRFASQDPASKSLLVSDYLGERLLDFGGSQSGLVGFLEKQGPSALRSFLRREKIARVARFTRVDPDLNQVPRAKPAPPAPPPAAKS